MKFELLILGFFLYFKQSQAAAGASWGYHGDTGPAKWKDNFKDCAEKNQSPINLVLNEAEYVSSLGAFTLTNFGQSTSHILKNNGHTVQVDVGGQAMRVTGGGLEGTFEVAQFHFHWGKDGNSGSEHTINGNAYPLEVHIVTYNTKYLSISNAVDKSDGLAVLGFFFEESEIENCQYNSLVASLANVVTAGTNTTVSGASLLQFIHQTSMKRYYRYKGSLTTPPCFESVTWTVFEDTIKLSAAQLAAFRTVKQADNTVIDMNYRPVQLLNGRKVKINFPNGVSSAQHVLYNSGLVLMTLFISQYSFH